MDKLLNNPHSTVTVAVCALLVIGALYVALFGLIHDGQTGIQVLAWFQNIIEYSIPAGTVTAVASQIIGYFQNKTNVSHETPKIP